MVKALVTVWPRWLLLASLATGCAGRQLHEQPPPPPVHEKVQSAADVARSIVLGRTGGLFEIAQFRFHPNSASAIGNLCNWAEATEALKLDPLNDIKRVFVAAHHALDSTGIALMEPEVDDQIVAEAIRRAGGRVGKDVAYPRVVVPIKNSEPHIVALIQPRLIVVAPERFQTEIEALRVRAELPPAEGTAAAQFFAFEPSLSLGTSPAWPDTILAAHAEIEFVNTGGAVVRFFADSISSEQAVRDAKALTAEAHRLLTVNLAIVELQLLTPPVFESSGPRVFMQSGLSPNDVDWLLRFNGSL